MSGFTVHIATIAQAIDSGRERFAEHLIRGYVNQHITAWRSVA